MKSHHKSYIDAKTLSKELGGRIRQGKESERISGVASIAEAHKGDISFYSKKAKNPGGWAITGTQASALYVIPGEIIEFTQEDITIIEVANPSLALARTARLLGLEWKKPPPGISRGAHIADMANIAKTACVSAGVVIEAGAHVEENVYLGPGVVIGQNARIGANSVLHANSSVREKCILGQNVILQQGAIIGSDGYGYEFTDGKHEFVPQVGIVELANDVEIGANTTVDRARFGKTYIGQGTKIDNLVQIAHNVKIGKHCLIVAQTAVAGSSILGDYVVIGGQAAVTGHVKVGNGTQIGARSGVSNNVTKEGQILWGIPARPIREAKKIEAAKAFLPKWGRRIREIEKEILNLKSAFKK